MSSRGDLKTTKESTLWSWVRLNRIWINWGCQGKLSRIFKWLVNERITWTEIQVFHLEFLVKTWTRMMMTVTRHSHGLLIEIAKWGKEPRLGIMALRKMLRYSLKLVEQRKMGNKILMIMGQDLWLKICSLQTRRKVATSILQYPAWILIGTTPLKVTSSQECRRSLVKAKISTSNL